MSTKHYIAYKQYEAKRGIGEFKDRNKKSLPEFILDDISDQVRDQGWTKQLRRSNKCSKCNTYFTKAMTCLCD